MSSKNGFFDKGDLAPDPMVKKVKQVEGDELPLSSRQYPPFEYQMDFSKLPSRTYSRMKPQHRRNASSTHLDQPRKQSNQQSTDSQNTETSRSPSAS